MPTTANMNLVLPTVSSTIGPDWATLLNAALTLVDSHDHSSGGGVKITPSGLNLNANVTLNDFYLTSVGSLRLTSLDANLATPSDVGCFYNYDGNLWWNNDAGAQVQITSGGSVIAASDGIARAFSRTAVASNTIISAAATVSYYDVDTTTGVTFTLPAANAVTAGRFYEFKDTTGSAAANNIVINRAGSDTIDGATSVTIDTNYGGRRLISDGTSKWSVSHVLPNKVQTNDIQDSAVTTAKINDGAVTPAKKAALGQQISGTAAFSTSSTTFVDVTNRSVTITTTGRPVFLGLQSSSAVQPGQVLAIITGASTQGELKFVRASTDLAVLPIFVRATGATVVSVRLPCSSFWFIDTPAAGTYTYKLQARAISGSDTITVGDCNLIAYEL